MNISWRTVLAVAFISGGLANSPAASGPELAGVALPAVTSAGNTKLLLNGAGIGTELIVKVYVIGLYLQRKTSDAKASIVTDESKRIVMTMLREVSRKRFVQAVEKGMEHNAGAQMPTLRARLDILEKALPDLQKGDFIEFTYLPGVGTVVRGQGRELRIPGKDFADALLSVWLGPKAGNSSLRAQLLRG